MKLRETKAKLEAEKNKCKQLEASKGKSDFMKSKKIQEEKQKQIALKQSMRDKITALAVSNSGS